VRDEKGADGDVGRRGGGAGLIGWARRVDRADTGAVRVHLAPLGTPTCISTSLCECVSPIQVLGLTSRLPSLSIVHAPIPNPALAPP
jgi:hypothetical protein